MVATNKLAILTLLLVLTGLQQLCQPPKAQGQIDSSDHYAVWNLLSENTIYPERLGTWKRWGQGDQNGSRVVSPASSGSDNAIPDMVSALADDYTYLMDAEDTDTHRSQWCQRNVVTGRMLAGNVAYIRVNTFYSTYLSTELQDALQMLAAADSFILDLRDNRGGDIYEAQKACAMFLDKGVFSTLKGRREGKPYREKLEVTATNLRISGTNGVSHASRVPNLTGKRPLVVLVNRKTRSAAEMVAGCLRDHHRALLVGERTYGKGVVQTTWALQDGRSMKIATARYFLPGGLNIHEIGLEPGVHVSNYGSADLQLAKSMEIVQGGQALLYAMQTAYSPQ